METKGGDGMSDDAEKELQRLREVNAVLLEACEAMLICEAQRLKWPGVEIGPPDPHQYYAAVQAIQAAIAKAKGETK